jgi:hypothetical protein
MDRVLYSGSNVGCAHGGCMGIAAVSANADDAHAAAAANPTIM